MNKPWEQRELFESQTIPVWAVCLWAGHFTSLNPPLFFYLKRENSNYIYLSVGHIISNTNASYYQYGGQPCIRSSQKPRDYVSMGKEPMAACPPPHRSPSYSPSPVKKKKKKSSKKHKRHRYCLSFLPADRDVLDVAEARGPKVAG